MQNTYACTRLLVGFATLIGFTYCQPSSPTSGAGMSAAPEPALSAPDPDGTGSAGETQPIGWSVVNLSPKVPLFGLWGAGARDVWAGGKDGLILQWDGRRWSAIPSPTSYCVRGLGGTGSRDIWAITTNLCPSAYHVSFSADSEILHWDGERWSRVASHSGELTAVAASTTDEAWAVGIDNNHGILLKWDGTKWQDYPKLLSNVPMSLSVQAKNDVWLATWYSLGSSPVTTKLQHWDGADWQNVSSYFPGPTLAAWGSGARDVWSAGEGATFSRWDGATWSRSAQFGLLGNADLYVYAGWSSGPDDAWAAGDTFMAHWDGKSWELRASPSPRSFALWGSGPGDIWLVGQQGMAHYYQP